MKTILITGSSTGIGRLTAIKFAKQGWNVIATMRTPEKEQEMHSFKNIHLKALDVNNQIMIESVIEETIKEFGKIDVLFNNAGYALVGAFEAMTNEDIKKQFDTNVFGVMSMTKAILPHFREKNGGMIINKTSMGGLITFPLYSVYHSTKWALEGFMESLQFEVKQFNIKIKNIEPGAIKTEFENALNFVEAVPYKKYTDIAHKNMLDAYLKAPKADVVAEKVYKAANDNNYRLRYPVGGSGPLLLVLRKILPLNWFTGMVKSQVEKGFKKLKMII
jgi:NADP-dependent 3-hydroxy acid dehydrogenase YdfG